MLILEDIVLKRVKINDAICEDLPILTSDALRLHELFRISISQTRNDIILKRSLVPQAYILK